MLARWTTRLVLAFVVAGAWVQAARADSVLRAPSIDNKAWELPDLTDADIAALREYLGDSSANGEFQSSGRLGELELRLADKAELGLAARTAEQAALGVPRMTKDVGAPSVLDVQGRWLGEISDVAPVRGRPGMVRAGALWQAWVTQADDVNTIRKRPRGWRGPRVPKNFKLNNFSTDWRGMFAKTSTGGLENGMSRGHIVPNASASRTHADQLSTFRLYSNAFPQSRDSNAGAWRNLEKTIQDVASGGEYVVYNYSGVLWQPTRYQKLDGTWGRVAPQMLETKDGKVPKPTAYWRVAVLVPTRGPGGEQLDLASGIARARPIAAIVPNAQDADLFVSDWSRFATTVEHIEHLAGLTLFTHLEGAPNGRKLLHSLRTHIDKGEGLPREQQMPRWKRIQMQQLLSNPKTVSPHAQKLAATLLKRDTAARQSRITRLRAVRATQRSKRATPQANSSRQQTSPLKFRPLRRSHSPKATHRRRNRFARPTRPRAKAGRAPRARAR